MSLISWLRTKPTPRYYWCDRAGFGVELESKTPVLGSLGLLRFDDRKPSDELWKPFGESRFIVPKELRTEIKSLAKPQKPDSLPLSSNWKGKEIWPAIVDQALAQIHSHQLQKVVLAQRHLLISPTPIDPLAMLERLKIYFPNAHLFLFEPRPGLAFIGASPERLYQRRGLKIESEAQAGTRLRGHTREEDDFLSQQLLVSSKDLHEHQLVVDNILNAFGKLCRDYGITDSKQIAKQPNVQHLKTKISGILNDFVTDQDILSAMHPTAAVCGWPIDKAFETIRNLEDFDRGFYAGSLGIVSEHESIFNVAIRAAVIRDCELHIFAGAGIVSGSIAASEQEEIKNKMAFWERLL
ncbi:MAG: isochorismate synthase [Myxococcaceae bacterium]